MSTLQPPKKIAQKKRLREWQDWLTNFEQYYRQTKKKIPFKYIENAAWILNDLYWRIAEQYLRPVLQTKNEDEEEHRIHFYKIISASEVTIMMVLPII